MQEPQNITLNFIQGNSRKTYQASLMPKGGGWMVSFAYGRIGGPLTASDKTPEPLAYDKARKVYDKLVASKQAKGYSASDAGTPYVGTDNAGRVSNILPQLLNPISAQQLDCLLADPEFCVEEKFDGERRLVRVGTDGIEGINRKGLIVALSEPIHSAVAEGDFPAGTVFDGEDMGDYLVVFDILEYAGKNVRIWPLLRRIQLRDKVCALAPRLWVAMTCYEGQAKRDMVASVKAAAGEGVVVKRLGALSDPGRPNSGGDALKFKFYETATVRVSARNDTKRSVVMEVIDGQKGLWHAVGNVTIPPNAAIPEQGALIECKYLYWFGPGGALFQPQFIRERPDQATVACDMAQLKIKGSLANAA